MFSRMHFFNVNILFNLNKDLIFVNGVSLLHMNRLHHPRYLDKLYKQIPSDYNFFSWLPSCQRHKSRHISLEFVLNLWLEGMLFTPSDNNNMFDNIHPAGQAVLHLHRLHHSTLLAVSNLIRPCNVCILYVMRVPKYSHLQYSTSKVC